MKMRILGLVLAAIMVIGCVNMAFADEKASGDTYRKDRALETIFKMYDEMSGEDRLLVAVDLMPEEDDTLKVGKHGGIKIKLPVNMDSDHSWHIEIENEEIVEVVSDEHKEAILSRALKDEWKIYGRLGTHIWNLKALREGVTKVTFKLYRDGEPGKVYEEKTYIVTVEKDGDKQTYGSVSMPLTFRVFN